MGWKTVKEEYAIGHIVHMREGKLCIGSPYCTALIEVGMDGQILKPYESYGTNLDLIRYMKEFQEDRAKLTLAILAEDKFERSLLVYTYSDELGVVEKLCEEYGWPNITHDGELMYENTFFETREEARLYGIKDQEATIRLCQSRLAQLDKDIAEVSKWLAEAEDRLEKLMSGTTA